MRISRKGFKRRATNEAQKLAYMLLWGEEPPKKKRRSKKKK